MWLRALAVVIVALALVRHDLWWWDDPERVLGLPVGLTYHVAFCFVVAGVMALFVRADRAPGGDDDGERAP